MGFACPIGLKACNIEIYGLALGFNTTLMLHHASSSGDFFLLSTQPLIPLILIAAGQMNGKLL